jgi:lipocalin-like protein
MRKDDLLGTWKLLSASSTSSTGERDEAPYGAGPLGFLAYGGDGRVSALISYGGRKPLSGIPKVQEQAETFKTFFAYAGRYTFNGDQIVHHVEVSSIRNFVNRDLVRTARLEADRIVLVTPPTPMNGKVQTVELTWQRLPAGS